MTLKEVKEMIEQLLISSEPERSKKLSVFQQLIWNDESIDFEEELYEVLYNLAVDLDYYEPNPEFRKDDISFYGDSRFIEVVQEGLDAINELEQKAVNE